MKCEECGKKIRWIDRLNPFRVVWRVDVVDENDKVIDSYRVCEKCSEWYQTLDILVSIHGEKEVIKMLKEIS